MARNQSTRAPEFFEFMAKREALRLKKETGMPWPWSDDVILNTYKFTNVKREHDRTTRWMRANWTQPNGNRPAGEIIFNCALFRYFGTSEFAEDIGWVRSWDANRAIQVAARREREGLRVFTGAYIIPTLGQKGPKREAICQLVLEPFWKARESLAKIAGSTNRWRDVAESMRKLPGFGGSGFMTKEVLLDVMQTPVLNQPDDRNTWCPAGPGARRGLNRLHLRKTDAALSEVRALDEMLSLFKVADRFLPAYMPDLELHDIQFQLCEFDKYERVRTGEGRPKAKYVLPKSQNILSNRSQKNLPMRLS